MLASGAVFVALPMQADSEVLSSYKLNLSNGRLPKDVESVNVNGVLPKSSAYKRGYTENGWTVDRLGSFGYVAITPTYTAGEGACENTLTLPFIKVEEGLMLKWMAQSVYRHFPERYRVEAVPADGSDAVTLAEIEAESYFATSHNISLDPVMGKEVALRFVCTSDEGYLLAMWDVEVGEGLEEPESAEAEESSDDSFIRKFLVDRGTGMWCVNCPAGEIAVEQLLEKFGDRLVAVNTHVNDALGNQAYWDELKWYAVPYMMLNRIKASAGENAKKFSQYYEQPTSFAIQIGEIPAPQGRKLDVTAKVKVAENIDNADGRYRVGYVVTGDFHEPTNMDFVQKNNCSQPVYGAYYYLPSTILPELMYYDDVSLTSDTAFSGIEGSLPVSLEPGSDYEVTWQVEVPELLADAADARVVAFVIDTTTGEAQNVDALRVGEKPTVKVAKMYDDAIRVLEPTSGGVRINLPEGETYRIDVYSTSGGIVESLSRVSQGYDLLKPSVVPGIYIVNLTSASCKGTCKVIIR